MTRTAIKPKTTSKQKNRSLPQRGVKPRYAAAVAQTNRRLLMICFTLVFAALGTVLLTFSSAATSQTSFSGTLSKKQPLRTHDVIATASGSVNATLSGVKSSTPLTLRLLQGTTVIAQTTGQPASLSAPVASGTYTFEVSGAVSSPTQYVLNVSYPVADPTPAPDTTPPTAPAGLTAAAASTTQVNLAWQSATDNIGVASYDVVRNGAVISHTTTTTYNDVNVAPATSYNYTVRAYDAAGNVSADSNLATAVTPAAADTTPPSITVSSPSQGQTVSGTVNVAGMSSDAAGPVRVDVQIDGTGFVPASYVASSAAWNYSLNTSLYTNGGHMLTARATDGAGNTAVASTSFSIQNSTSSTTTGTTAPTTQGTWTSPEGAVITVTSTQTNPATGQLYTIKWVYDMLKQESAAAGDFAKIAPCLTVKVQDSTSSQTSTSAGTVNGLYTSFHATVYLKGGAGSTYGTRPNQITAHEYGHAWTQYYHYLVHNGSYADYLATRWSGPNGIPLIGQDSRLDSTYNWSTNEMIADDYRLLFGTSVAQSQAGYINSDVVDSRNQPGLGNWFLSSWK